MELECGRAKGSPSAREMPLDGMGGDAESAGHGYMECLIVADGPKGSPRFGSYHVLYLFVGASGRRQPGS